MRGVVGGGGEGGEGVDRCGGGVRGDVVGGAGGGAPVETDNKTLSRKCSKNPLHKKLIFGVHFLLHCAL